MWGTAEQSDVLSLSREPLAKEGPFKLNFKGRVRARTRGERRKVRVNALAAMPGIVDFRSKEVTADVKPGDEMVF